jgi:phospholipid/cholesterol/gamma-HCH transport system permease protein
MMNKNNSTSQCTFSIDRSDPSQLLISLAGPLTVKTVSPLFKSIGNISSKDSDSIHFNLQKVTAVDDFGLFTLAEFHQQAARYGNKVFFEDHPADVQNKLNSIDLNATCMNTVFERRSSENYIFRLGVAAIVCWKHLLYTISFIGSIMLSFLDILRRPRLFRAADTLIQMEKTGVDALPVVGLISFLLGLIIAFMSSIQLEQFGANIYVASLVALAMTSELGPIMTAIVVAGRSGSAFAAEIGSMRISEEIDALFIMGFNPTVFLAVPRIVASALVVPLLSVFSSFFGIAGGLVLGVLLLGLTPTSYIAKTMDSLSVFEVTWGIFKSFIFAILVSTTGCLRGFQVRGGADAVGNAATSAVVTSIFLIILFDSIFAVIRTYWT